MLYYILSSDIRFDKLSERTAKLLTFAELVEAEMSILPNWVKIS
jgi:hypothetical protein